MCPTRLAKLESAMRIVLEYKEAYNRHDVAGMLELVSDDCILESSAPAPDGTVHSGMKAIAQFWQDFFSESPQAHIKVEEIFGLGERCIMRWRYEWFTEVGKIGHVRGVDIFLVRGGIIRAIFSYSKG
jgi:hypothetical protein